MMDIIMDLLPYGGTAVAFLVGLYKDRILHALNIKQKKVEVDNNIIDHHEKNIQLYQEMLDDIDTRYKKRIVDLETSFNEQIDKIKEDISELKIINEELSDIIARQAKELLRYKELYGPLPENE